MPNEHIVILSSTADRDIFPENRGGAFVNKLQNEIILDSNLSHEVALMDVFFPKDYFGIIKDDPTCAITVHVTSAVLTGGVEVYQTASYFSYIPRTNILAGDVQNIVDNINTELNEVFARKAFFLKAINVLLYDADANRVSLNLLQGVSCGVEGPACAIKLGFGERIASILGFESGEPYQFYSAASEGDHKTGRLISPFPPSPTAGLNYVMIYSDIVQRTPFGSRMVNILDIVNFDDKHTKSHHNTIYYPLNTNNLSSISIKLADQNGREIIFKKDSSVICLLRIRPKAMV